MVQWARVLSAPPDNLSFISRTHRVERTDSEKLPYIVNNMFSFLSLFPFLLPSTSLSYRTTQIHANTHNAHIHIVLQHSWICSRTGHTFKSPVPHRRQDAQGGQGGAGAHKMSSACRGRFPSLTECLSHLLPPIIQQAREF